MTDGADQAQSFEALLIRHEELEQEKNPDISHVDHTILKDGPRAFKAAVHLAIRDRHTEAFHHNVVKIESFRRVAGSWEHLEPHSVTLDDEHEDQIGRLLTFLHAITALPESQDHYAIVPLGGAPADRAAVSRILDNLARSDIANVLMDLLARANGGVEVLRDLASSNPEASGQAAAALNVARYSAAVDTLAVLIESNAREGEFQSLLAQNPWMFGSEYSELLDRRRWTRDEQQDFMLRRTADGYLELVEIKTPLNGAALFLEDRSHATHFPRQDLAVVLGQVTHYLEKLDSNQLSIRALDRENVAKIRAKIIIGRDGDDDQVEALRRLNGHLHRIEILTFDQLLRIARRIVSYFQGIMAPTSEPER